MSEIRFLLRYYDTATMLFCICKVFLWDEVKASDVKRIAHCRTLSELRVHFLDEFRTLCLGFGGRRSSLRLNGETELTDVAQTHGVAIL